jgi:pyruvate,water dikinase
MFQFFKKRIAEAKERENLVFREKYHHFQELLDRNNEILEAVSTLIQLRDQQKWINLGRLRAMVTTVAVNVYRLIQNLNFITENRYRSLDDIFASLQENIVRALDNPVTPRLDVYTISLKGIGRELAQEVGSKAANLGEIGKNLSVGVPRGMAITASAYKSFYDHNKLAERINKENVFLEPDDLNSIHQVSQKIQELIMSASLPLELEEALRAAHQELKKTAGESVSLILRSSALGEDELGTSFAGLYESVMNPRPEELPKAYKQVIASKYSPRAISYRLQKRSYGVLNPMCAVLMELVPAVAGGVMYTRDPNAQAEELVINAVWGLGKPALDGTVIPDRYRVKPAPSVEILEKEVSYKETRLELAEGGGLRTVRMEDNLRHRPCLSDEQILHLAGVGFELVNLFDGPQDVEWVLHHGGRILIVQSRPLKIEASEHAWADSHAKMDLDRTNPPIVRGLQVASAGVAHGKTVVLKKLSDMERFQKGEILMVKNTAPDLVSILPRVKAVISEKGSTTGHLSIIAREFRVPMLIGLPPAMTTQLEKGMEVTVDALTGAIYSGEVLPLIKMASLPKHAAQSVVPTPTERLLDGVLQYITPLNLINPRDPSFRPQSIRTIHDIIRFAHEMAINAMFDLNDSRYLGKGEVRKLRSNVPLSIYMIDIGDGLREGQNKKEVLPEDVESIPMRALYRGMTTEGVRWAGHIPIDFKSFISVFANTLYDGAKHERQLGERSYAIVSRNYVNFSSRLGYHFSIVDAYVGPVANENYISFRFKGGAASVEKRTRRVRFIGEVLARQGFWVDQKADLVNARVKRLTRAETEEKLVMVGRLMGCSRQLDVTMKSDAVIDRYVELFLQGDYSMGYEDSESRSYQ